MMECNRYGTTRSGRKTNVTSAMRFWSPTCRLQATLLTVGQRNPATPRCPEPSRWIRSGPRFGWPRSVTSSTRPTTPNPGRSQDAAPPIHRASSISSLFSNPSSAAEMPLPGFIDSSALVSIAPSSASLIALRNYDVSLPHNKIPDALCVLSKKMAIPAMPSGEEFQPEAPIVNYFGPSDMLGGHLDDIGADWSKPIMSISLGCKSFALLGGKSREDNPRAMLLRGGYIVLMAGQARECFHGIPGIFTGDEHADISALLSHFSGKDDCFFMDYIRYSRININTR
ncbi:alpha-ketoglutarate-dependent dioxygenase alkB-like isoform X2 [Phoenix dactylifera]|uniref:Alpha-ketoglutarate-dependent dioxygenase alkB-like isoform X2 n=1 Tax=Phoenix dactylifera TaxID=42345 RepID=A0A8B9B0P4_PHODC|nr:alpha-ketoglutarate-dependent dioxygenase alkB-like isoform X2 [Phoenix dactylifera]